MSSLSSHVPSQLNIDCDLDLELDDASVEHGDNVDESTFYTECDYHPSVSSVVSTVALCFRDSTFHLSPNFPGVIIGRKSVKLAHLAAPSWLPSSEFIGPQPSSTLSEEGGVLQSVAMHSQTMVGDVGRPLNVEKNCDETKAVSESGIAHVAPDIPGGSVILGDEEPCEPQVQSSQSNVNSVIYVSAPTFDKDSLCPVIGIHAPRQRLDKSKTISRKHLLIFFNTDRGSWMAKALGKNGFFVNGAYVKDNSDLLHGYKVQIGPVDFLFISIGKLLDLEFPCISKATGGISYEFDISHGNATQFKEAPHLVSLRRYLSQPPENDDDAQTRVQGRQEEDIPSTPEKQTGGTTGDSPSQVDLTNEELDDMGVLMEPFLAGPLTAHDLTPDLYWVLPHGTPKKGPGRPPRDGQKYSRRVNKLLVAIAKQKYQASHEQVTHEKYHSGIPPKLLQESDSNPDLSISRTKLREALVQPAVGSSRAEIGENDQTRSLKRCNSGKVSVKSPKRPRGRSSTMLDPPEFKLNREDFDPAQLAKPDKTYATLIYEILLEEDGPLQLQSIYQRIMAKYPYYYFRSPDTDWRSSVRHNLLQNDCFWKEEDGWRVNKNMNLSKSKRGKASRRLTVTGTSETLSNSPANPLSNPPSNPDNPIPIAGNRASMEDQKVANCRSTDVSHSFGIEQITPLNPALVSQTAEDTCVSETAFAEPIWQGPLRTELQQQGLPQKVPAQQRLFEQEAYQSESSRQNSPQPTPSPQTSPHPRMWSRLRSCCPPAHLGRRLLTALRILVRSVLPSLQTTHSSKPSAVFVAAVLSQLYLLQGCPFSDPGDVEAFNAAKSIVLDWVSKSSHCQGIVDRLELVRNPIMTAGIQNVFRLSCETCACLGTNCSLIPISALSRTIHLTHGPLMPEIGYAVVEANIMEHFAKTLSGHEATSWFLL